MKNDEYNNMTITNTGKTGNFEFTKAQRSEYSSYFDNVDPNKDELNNRKTVNDSVSENTLKSSKTEEKKRQENNTEQVKNVANSASTAAGHSFVAVATASVVAISAAVGINILHEDPEKEDLVTFISSEIGAEEAYFSFSMPLHLLSYEETEEQRESYKEVVALVQSSSGYDEKIYIPEYEVVEETFGIFYTYIYGLTPGENYALTLSIEEAYFSPEKEDEPIYLYQELAYRTFTTLEVEEIPVGTITIVEATSSDVVFSYRVKASDIGYDIDEQLEIYNISAEITNESGYYDSMWFKGFEVLDETYIEAYGSFSSLDSDTEYTISIYQSLENEYKKLASATFYTQSGPTSEFAFQRFVVEENSVSYTFSVLGSYIGYPEVENPDVVAVITSPDNQALTESFPVSNWSSYGSYALGIDTITDLIGGTDYTISMYYLHDNEQELLGSRDFTTTESTTGFAFFDNYVTDVSIQINFIIKSNLVQQVQDGSNISIKIELDGDTMEILNINNFQDSGEEGKLFGSGIFEELTPNTTYFITVYDEITEEIYGSQEVTTNRSNYTNFGYISIEPSENGVSFSFCVSASYVHYDEDPSAAEENVYGTIDNGTGSPLRCSVSLEYIGNDTLLGTCVITSGLSSGVEYTLNMYFDYEGTTTSLTLYTAFTTLSSSFNGLTCDYGVYVDTSTNEDIYMPVKLDFVNDSHAYDDGFIMTITVADSHDETYVATLDATTEYQYAHLTGQYFSRYSGESFEVTVSTNDGENTTLYTDRVTISEAANNKFFACSFPEQQLNENNLTFLYDAIYVIANPNLTMQMVFNDGNNSIVYTMSPQRVPTSSNSILLSAPLNAPSGTSFESYEDIKNALSGTYNVYITYVYSSMGLETDLLIAEGFTFNFA